MPSIFFRDNIFPSHIYLEYCSHAIYYSRARDLLYSIRIVVIDLSELSECLA
jgi:hypothetical protein